MNMFVQYLSSILVFIFFNKIDFVRTTNDFAHAASLVRREIWNWWDYSDGVSGPASWGFYFPLCDLGRFQSPINIESQHLIFDHQLTEIKMNNSENVR